MARPVGTGGRGPAWTAGLTLYWAVVLHAAEERCAETGVEGLGTGCGQRCLLQRSAREWGSPGLWAGAEDGTGLGAALPRPHSTPGADARQRPAPVLEGCSWLLCPGL